MKYKRKTEDFTLEGVSFNNDPIPFTWKLRNYFKSCFLWYRYLFEKHITKRKGICIIATTTSPEKTKKRADWICDGVNDEFEFQAAIDDGYKILLISTGEYYFDNEVQLNTNTICGINSGKSKFVV